MMRKIIDIITRPIRENSIFYASMFALFSISALFVLYYGSRAVIGLEIFFDVYIISLIATITPEWCRKQVKWGLFLIFATIGIVDMLCYQSIGTALTPNILTTWLQTNSDEASEAISSYFNRDLILSPLALFFLLPFGILLLKRIGLRIGRRLSTVIAMITLVSTIYGFENKIYILKTYRLSTDDTMVEVCDYSNISREYLPHYRLLYSLKEIDRFSDMRENLMKNIQTASIDSCSQTSPIIVLIIGESYNRHHASLYGYEKKTTPRQDSLFDKGRLYRFNNVISSYNLTFRSFQNMLSMYNYDKPGKWHEYPLITTLFRKGGYTTGFFSNQFCLDKRASLSEVIDDIFINNGQMSPQMFDKRNAITHQYDIELIEEYKKHLGGEEDKPQFVIFHFMGMHAEFSKRYPDEFAKFSGSDYNRNDLNGDEREVIAQYDNAIYYNDYVLDSIIRYFDNKEAVIVHCPDHGEMVYDNSTIFGRKLYFDREVVIPQYDIPFSIYCSPLYRERHGEICDMMARSTDKPFMTDDLPHLLLYLAGIDCIWYEESRNIISDRFNTERPRRICNEVDYDVLCGNRKQANACETIQ